MKISTVILFVVLAFAAKAQKVDSIYFNLYTDSLKKGVYNYINVDGKLSSGTFLPLMSDEVRFTSSFGKWEGNSLIIDSASKVDSVVVTAALKDRPEIKRSVTIFIKKVEIAPVLKTEEELLNEWGKKAKPRKNLVRSFVAGSISSF